MRVIISLAVLPTLSLAFAPSWTDGRPHSVRAPPLVSVGSSVTMNALDVAPPLDSGWGLPDRIQNFFQTSGFSPAHGQTKKKEKKQRAAAMKQQPPTVHRLETRSGTAVPVVVKPPKDLTQRTLLAAQLQQTAAKNKKKQPPPQPVQAAASVASMTTAEPPTTIVVGNTKLERLVETTHKMALDPPSTVMVKLEKIVDTKPTAPTYQASHDFMRASLAMVGLSVMFMAF